jgi:hypothetical protein
MSEIAIKEDLGVRNKIFNLELLMNEGLDSGKLAPVKKSQVTYRHLFTEKHKEHGVGMYAREMTAPATSLMVGYIHKESHFTFLNKGKVRVLSEARGVETLTAPCSFVSPLGSCRAIYVIEECVMTCVYLSANPEKDKEGLSEELQDDLTPYELSLLTDNYRDVGLSPPSENKSQGVLEWLDQKY